MREPSPQFQVYVSGRAYLSRNVSGQLRFFNLSKPKAPKSSVTLAQRRLEVASVKGGRQQAADPLATWTATTERTARPRVALAIDNAMAYRAPAVQLPF